MCAAVVATHLDAHHAMAVVDDALDHLAVDRLRIARPSAARIELRRRGEQQRSAADAAVAPLIPVIPVLAAERSLGGGMARHLVLHGVERGAPLGIGLLDFVVAHGGTPDRWRPVKR